MTQQQHQSSGWGWPVAGGLVIAGGAGLLGAMKVALFVFPVPHLTFLHYLATIVLGWGSSVVWGTKQPLAHPLGFRIVSYVVVILELVLVGGLYEAARYGASSMGKVFSFGGGGNTTDRDSDDPARWLRYDRKAFKAYLPSQLVKRNEIRPSMKQTPIKDRRLDDFGFVVGYARNNPDDPVVVSAELSMLVIGEPRSGKTGRLVIPWVMSWQGPLVTTSTKNEVLTTTLLARKRVSEHVYVLGLPGTKIPEGVEPISYDICWFYEGEWEMLIESANRRAAIFAEVAADKGQPVWEKASKPLFACLLLIGFAWRCAQIEYQGQAHSTGKPNLFSMDPKSGHIGVLQKLSTLEWAKDEKDVAALCAFLKDSIPGGFGWDVADYVEGVARTFRGGAGDTEFARTITSMIAVGFSKLNDPQIAAVFSTPWNKPIFDPETFLSESGTLYLMSRIGDSAELAKFFSVVVDEIAGAAKRRAQTMKRCDPPLALILDEVANIAPLPDLKSYMSEGGGQGIATVSVVQNFSQLKSTYGETKADEIWSSANVILAFGGEKDPDTLRRLTALAGNTTVSMGSYDAKGKLTGRNDTTQAALDPDKISNMPKGWMLMHVPNADTVIGKAPYWSDKPGSRWLGRRGTKDAPEVAPSGPKWNREWGGALDEEPSGYPYHGTKRALSYRAACELGRQSLEIPLKKLVVERPERVSDAVPVTDVGSANTEQFKEVAFAQGDIVDGDIVGDEPEEQSPGRPVADVKRMPTSFMEKRSGLLEGEDGIDRLFDSIPREEERTGES